MLDEDYFNGADRLIGKKYAGVRIPIPKILLKKRGLLRLWGCPIGLRRHCIEDFKDGKVIFIYRTPEENIRSMLKHAKYSRKTAEKDLQISREIFNVLVEDPTWVNVTFVSLQRLTMSPDSTLRYVCNFLKIPYDPDMVEGYKHNPHYKYNTIIPKK